MIGPWQAPPLGMVDLMLVWDPLPTHPVVWWSVVDIVDCVRGNQLSLPKLGKHTMGGWGSGSGPGIYTHIYIYIYIYIYFFSF